MIFALFERRTKVPWNKFMTRSCLFKGELFALFLVSPTVQEAWKSLIRLRVDGKISGASRLVISVQNNYAFNHLTASCVWPVEKTKNLFLFDFQLIMLRQLLRVACGFKLSRTSYHHHSLTFRKRQFINQRRFQDAKIDKWLQIAALECQKQ